MIRMVTWAGLILLVVAGLLLAFSDTEMSGAHPHILKTLLAAGAALTVAGLCLSALVRLVKFGKIRIGRRCPACHRSVRPGHIYCEDHFRDAVNRARDTIAIR